MSAPRVKACVAVGANLGDAQGVVRQALRDLKDLPQTQVVNVSSLYRTAPLEATGPDFINAVALLETSLSPLDLLHALQSMELRAGRERPYRNAPRTLDLDVIFHGEQVCATSELTLPHPRWQTRAFVVMPLVEICPECVSPALLAGVQNQVVQRIPDGTLL
jgi:2-amino-4-hydroxy-6-hydroxymethyldihydropteridine diphosphokinase